MCSFLQWYSLVPTPNSPTLRTKGSVIPIPLSVNRCSHTKNQFDKREQDWLVRVSTTSGAWHNVGRASSPPYSRRQKEALWINLGFWESAHLPLPWANIITCFSLRAKCWLRGGVGGQFLRKLHWSGSACRPTWIGLALSCLGFREIGSSEQCAWALIFPPLSLVRHVCQAHPVRVRTWTISTSKHHNIRCQPTGLTQLSCNHQVKFCCM